jgi:hypothetical protein
MKKYAITLMLLVSLLFGCTKKFEEINTNPVAIAKITASEFPFLFSTAETRATFASEDYQVAQSLFADQFAQYFANTTTYFNSDRYVMRMDWLASMWAVVYVRTAPQLQLIMKNSNPNSPEYALASIWWVYTFHRLTDYIGPIPYFKVGENLESMPYDAQDKIYDDFFKRLASADATLKANAGKNIFGTFDLIYGGNVDKWRRFCNSLRLRLALRVSKVDAARAKTEAEASVASGVLENFSDNALIQRRTVYEVANGLALQTPWNEFRMSAAMESVLNGYQDPRRGVYFNPTVNAATSYRGIRNGLTAAQIANNTINNNNNLSNLGSKWDRNLAGNNDNARSASQEVICAAESFFLRAEGAVNGWNMGGTAKTLYDAGITNSLNQWGITNVTTINSYLNSTSTPVALNDFLNSPALSNIPVLFDLVNVNVQREQIGTQKWLALFPDGFEAWAEFRRTRFPKLYPVPNSENPDIAPGVVLRRIPFLDVDKQTNKLAVDAAVSLLGTGGDKVTTALWWDKN